MGSNRGQVCDSSFMRLCRPFEAQPRIIFESPNGKAEPFRNVRRQSRGQPRCRGDDLVHSFEPLIEPLLSKISLLTRLMVFLRVEAAGTDIVIHSRRLQACEIGQTKVRCSIATVRRLQQVSQLGVISDRQ
jgi:hypothetical protein